jgi:hypothetical protein
VEVTLNPPGQYANDRNLRARQRFWQHQDPYFDDVGWVLGLAGLAPVSDSGLTGEGGSRRPESLPERRLRRHQRD